MEVSQLVPDLLAESHQLPPAPPPTPPPMSRAASVSLLRASGQQALPRGSASSQHPQMHPSASFVSQSAPQQPAIQVQQLQQQQLPAEPQLSLPTHTIVPSEQQQLPLAYAVQPCSAAAVHAQPPQPQQLSERQPAHTPVVYVRQPQPLPSASAAPQPQLLPAPHSSQPSAAHLQPQLPPEPQQMMHTLQPAPEDYVRQRQSEPPPQLPAHSQPDSAVQAPRQQPAADAQPCAAVNGVSQPGGELPPALTSGSVSLQQLLSAGVLPHAARTGGDRQWTGAAGRHISPPRSGADVGIGSALRASGGNMVSSMLRASTAAAQQQHSTVSRAMTHRSSRSSAADSQMQSHGPSTAAGVAANAMDRVSWQT
eukprot:TRINITY_DN19537_c1_g1_i2.p1 TRINITY_DN19537_c1_g1~~TRINITY_DN19537_c1_g1_i2.p1  ORF type:complete len:367 (+),score=92.60 TRINITY_DN19537_c1_g1_i2:731-1831(+)